MSIDRIQALHNHPVVRQVAEAAGEVPCHLVGGMLRDAALGRPTKDVDVTVAGHGEDVARRLAETLPARLVHLGGKAFPSYRLVTDDFEVDVWDRKQNALAADLARRDFTINALALDLHDPAAEPEDPFGGLEDLRRRRLRATSPEVLRSDPLRVLRLARFLVVLPRFSADPKTVRLARQAAPGLADVAPERIREELARILSSDRAVVGFANMWDTGLYPGLFRGRPGTFQASRVNAAPLLLLYLEVTSKRAVQLIGLSYEVGVEPPSVDYGALHLALAVVSLLADEPGAVLDDLRDRGLLTRAQAPSASLLARSRNLPLHYVTHCRWLHQMGDLWPAALLRLSTLHPYPLWSRQARELIRLAAAEGDRIFDPPRLLSGDDAAELLDLKPGPELGRALEALKMAQVEGRVRDRDGAFEWLAENPLPPGASE